MDELIQAMSNDQLLAIKDEHSDNASIVTLVEGILEKREQEAQQDQVKVDFEAAIESLVHYEVVTTTTKKGKTKTTTKGLPTPPEGVHNLYLRWAEVEVPEGEAEDVEIPDPEDATKTITETRQPMVKVWAWVVEVNKATTITHKAPSDGGNKEPGKRAIVVKAIVNDQVVDLGEFASGADFCRAKGIDYTNNSPIRALKSAGFLPYAKTDGKPV